MGLISGSVQMKGFQGLASPIQVVKMASLRIPTAIVRTYLQILHKNDLRVPVIPIKVLHGNEEQSSAILVCC